MKKIIVLLLIFITGCTSDKIVFENQNYILEGEYYNIYAPLKKSVSNYYSLGDINLLEKENISKELMYISLKYYDNKRYYLENGQYIDDVKMKSYLENSNILFIEEQNFVNSDGKISGISLGLVYKDIDLEKERYAIDSLISKIRKDKKLEGIDFLVALYKTSSSDYIQGKYVYTTFLSGTTTGSYKKTEHERFIFPSTSLMNYDNINYNNFIKLKSDVLKNDERINIIGNGFYVMKKLKKLSIEIDILGYDNELAIKTTTSVANNLYIFNSDVSVIVKYNNVIISTINYKDKKSVIDFY